MAFNQGAYNGTYLASNGVQPNLVHGQAALDSGAVTVTVPGNRQVITAWAESQTANAARVSATAGATLSLAGTGSDVVAWFAIVK